MNRREILIGLGLIALAAVFFAPVLFLGRVLVPFDDLYRFPPWNAFASQFGITIPHNELVLDLVLENYAWKKFIVESIQAHELPLWNPYLFSGVPFLAAGQHSALYPFSILFYILPIDRAYGIFVALQIALAAVMMFAFLRILGLERFPASASAITYAFSSFMVVSTAFPMVISAAAWLPGILACAEIVLRGQPGKSRISQRQIFAGLIGALFSGIQFLAGHVEISMYVLMVTGLFVVGRSLALGLGGLWLKWLLLGAMVAIGIALGGVQLIPLFELVQQNFRSGSVTYQDVIGWAYPAKQFITFLIPDFFGNPTAHSYFDIFDLTSRSAPTGTIFWGAKNYVEAGSYVGILPLALALVAVSTALTRIVQQVRRRFRRSQDQPGVPSDRLESTDGTANLLPLISFFAFLAVVSLLFTFGTPLYSILFFGVPGMNQLHSPFRWVFPYTLSMAVLAGIGSQILVKRWRGPLSSSLRIFTIFPVGIGALVLIALAVSLYFPTLTVTFADRVLKTSTMASAIFDSGRMFYSYEFRNVLLFALFTLGTGLVILSTRLRQCLPRAIGGMPVWQLLAILLLVGDLFIAGMSFYPAADSQLGTFTPPAVQFLQQDKSLYRITSYDGRGGPEEKVMNPNAGMLFGISDIRGYDSIIPKQYADLMGLFAPQDELLNNRIAPFYSPDPLSSPILSLLNVKYVLTKRPLPNAGYTLVYDKEIQIYRNDRVLPRAFMVPNARVVSDRAQMLREMTRLDPAAEVLIDQAPAVEPEPVNSTSCSFAPVIVDKYSNSEVILQSSQACAGWLVLSDSYFPGWDAQLDGVNTTLYRADYNFRAVYVPPGSHTVRFKYGALSLRVGAITSFLGGMIVLLGFAYLAWKRFYPTGKSSDIRTVAKNSILPMATSLLMKGMDIIYAFFWLRMLGPTGTGRYTWAVNVWFFANTIADFGLGILLTREVTRDRSQANRYLTNSIVLRVILWAITLVPFGIIGLVYNVTSDTMLTIWLLLLGILPSTVSASLAFLFNAYETFEYRVAVDMVTRILSISLGVVALLLGYGIVGLAAASIITNLFTLVLFYILVRVTLFVPRLELDLKLVQTMVSESYPLMLNNLLSSLFFRIDVFILQPLKGDAVLGYYSTAYKFIDALNFIPSNFTLAIFPMLSRMAASAKDAMLRAYILSLKLLLWIALPITVGTIFVSRELITIFGGEAYLPHSAIALQVLIWFLPFSFINSVTHYVLIALGQQRFLTKAFILGLVFNIAANVIAIQGLSYVGAALVTVLSEIVLLLPFYYCVRQNLASVPFISIVWRPALASALMGVSLWFMVQNVGLLVAVPIAGLAYVALLVAFGIVGEDERALLRRLVPVRFHRLARIEG